MARLPIPRRLTIAGAAIISVIVAAMAAVGSAYEVGVVPPKLKPRELQVAGTATHVLVDAPDSWILDDEAGLGDFVGLSQRAELLANRIVSPPLVARIGRRIGVPPDQIGTVLRLTAPVPFVMRDLDSEQRAYILAGYKRPYRLEIQTDKTLPIVHIYSQAPSPAAAVALADATVETLGEDVRELADRDGIAPSRRPHLEQLAPPRGGVLNRGAKPQIVLLTFIVSFGVCCSLLLLIRRAWLGWAAAGRGAGASPTPPPDVDAADADDDAWPRTSRVLPWMIAGFIAVLWLVPFNSIELTANLPFDLKFDRLVLPFVFAVWVLALAAGGRATPRIRITWVHAGIAAFVGTACLSVVLDAGYLNHTLDFDLAAKKIVLLVSYLLLFVIVASVLRPAEVHAFLTYSLVLAVICAIGTIWEFRFRYNVFYSVSDAVLPGIFKIQLPEIGLEDTAGRAATRGSADHPLETVAMLSMALPIALVALVGSKTRRDRLLYGLAACVLIAATVSTYRKSALLAPLSVVLTLMYFRRRELMRLAPAGVVFVVLIQFLAPGALGSIVSQVQPDQLGVGTVSDRASDYDAVRPEVWSHLAFGRGYGSLDPWSFRVLDSDVLSRLVDTGIVGLLTLLLMPISILLVARGLIRARDARWSPPALTIAAAAVSFLVVEFLFDVSSFPHAPYILMTLAGALAVIVARGSPVDEPSGGPGGHADDADEWLEEPQHDLQLAGR
jgi:hypothetical protein